MWFSNRLTERCCLKAGPKMPGSGTRKGVARKGVAQKGVAQKGVAQKGVAQKEPTGGRLADRTIRRG